MTPNGRNRIFAGAGPGEGKNAGRYRPGLYRLDPGEDTWHSVTAGLPENVESFRYRNLEGTDSRLVRNSAYVRKIVVAKRVFARGELVDENALQDALERGHLSGAGLDCFNQEPPNPGHPLLQMQQVLLTPHIGAQTDEARNNMGWMALKDCLAVLRGEPPEHIVNPDVYSS